MGCLGRSVRLLMLINSPQKGSEFSDEIKKWLFSLVHGNQKKVLAPAFPLRRAFALSLGGTYLISALAWQVMIFFFVVFQFYSFNLVEK